MFHGNAEETGRESLIAKHEGDIAPSNLIGTTPLTFPCSKTTIVTLEKGVKCGGGLC